MGVFYWLASSTTHLSQPVDLTPSTQQAQFQAHTSSSGDAVSQSVNPPHTGKQELAPGLQPKSSSVCQQQRQQQLKQPCSPIRDSVTSIHTSERRLLMTSRQKALWAAAVGVLFRPSSLLFWVPLGESNCNRLVISKVAVLLTAGQFCSFCVVDNNSLISFGVHRRKALNNP